MLGVPLPPTSGDRLGRALDTARLALGNEAATLLAAGEALTVEQAIAAALADEPALAGSSVRDAVGHLTARERDVVVLIARGLGNREIAAELVVSVRTVESHVANVRAKLELASRAQIAVWALERKLLG
jgi:DNA-binding NarL/FixJ family response regulator